MTYTSYKSNKSYTSLLPHGGYRQLASYQMATIIYDLTVVFCQKFVDKTYMSTKSYKFYSRQSDQMIQAARSGKQNIAEGSLASGTSRKTELKLINVARASQEELLADYEDFLRQNHLLVWDKNSPASQAIRGLAYKTYKTYKTYMSYMGSAESAANCLICLINQACYLLDRQLRSLEASFLKHGGYSEQLFHQRLAHKPLTTARICPTINL